MDSAHSHSVLLTGFEPFGTHDVNPSACVARRLDGYTVQGFTVETCVLPVTSEDAPVVLLTAVRRVRPAAIVSVGLAAGRAKMAIERVATNVLDFPIPDNSGALLVDAPASRDGPDAYFSTLPIREICHEWQTAGIPGYISATAGAFICNQVFYIARHATNAQGVPAGFIHVPYLPEQAARSDDVMTPSMSLEVMVEAVQLAIDATVLQLKRAASASSTGDDLQ